MNEIYENAKAFYATLGVDTEKAIEKMLSAPLSLHCWQGDDVLGFDSDEALSGGISATGNYPGRARTPEELMQDLDFALALIPGKKKLNLHASYALFAPGEKADRDAILPRHFAPWVEFAKKHGMGLDFNPTFFSHPMAKDNLTLSHPDENIRAFWVRHGKACLAIARYFAEETGVPCVMNIWIPDGYKDLPADRVSPRMRFKKSLDEILSFPYDRKKVFVTLESKVFGIGLESYTVGSSEFCLAYAQEKGITPLLDNGHYHPTEEASDKISSLLCFHKNIGLHLTRSVRWDSDHVPRYNDELRRLLEEVVAVGLDRVFLSTDYFDASINRVFAWVAGARNVRKALLWALLLPKEKMDALQNDGEFTALFALQERLAAAPFGAVWEEALNRCELPADEWEAILPYEKEILEKRN